MLLADAAEFEPDVITRDAEISSNIHFEFAKILRSDRKHR
jgi:hypothetical protein